MAWEYLIIRYIHFIAMAFGVGGATVAMIISRMADKNPEMAPTVIKVLQPISKIIWVGIILLILSGFAFSFVTTTRSVSQPIFAVKILLVAILLINGLFLTFVLNPKLQRLMPKTAEMPSPEFLKVKKYLKISSIVSLGAWYAIMALAVAMLYL